MDVPVTNSIEQNIESARQSKHGLLNRAFADVVSDSCEGCIDDRDLTCIVFIAGYVARKVCKLFGCKLCQYELCTDRELLCEFGENLDEKFLYIDILNRGGLKWPTQFLTDIVSDVFVVFNCLISKKYESEFCL